MASKEFRRYDPEQAATLAVLRWFDRNPEGAPDSRAGALLEMVAAYASYLHDTGLLDAPLANQVLDAVYVSHRRLVAAYPTTDERRGIDMESATDLANQYIASFSSPPSSPTNDESGGNVTPPPKGVTNQSDGRHSKLAKIGAVCEAVFGRVGVDQRAPAPTSVNYVGIEKRKPFKAHYEIPELRGRLHPDILRSVVNFVKSVEVALPVGATVGAAILLCNDFGPIQIAGALTLGTTPFIVTVVKKARETPLKKLERSMQSLSLGDVIGPGALEAGGKLTVGGFTVGGVINQYVSNVLYVRQLVVREFSRVDSNVQSKYTDIKARPEHANDDDRMIQLRAVHEAFTSGWSSYDTKIRIGRYHDMVTNQLDPLNEQMTMLVNRLFSASYPGTVGEAPWTAAALWTAVFMAVLRYILNWSTMVYEPQRVQQYLSLNNPTDAKKWVENLTIRVKEVHKKIPTEQPVDRDTCDELEARLKDVLDDRVSSRDIPVHDQVSEFIETMIGLRAQVCALEAKYLPELPIRPDCRGGDNDGDAPAPAPVPAGPPGQGPASPAPRRGRPEMSPARRQPDARPPGPRPAVHVTNDDLANAGLVPFQPGDREQAVEELDGNEALDLYAELVDDDNGAGVGLGLARPAPRAAPRGTRARAPVVDAAYRARLRALRL